MDRRLMNTSYLADRIKDLHKLHKKTVADYGELVQSLTQEAEIFVELVPNYKISTSVNDEVRMKKEVRTIEKLEHELLTQYEHFLQLLKKLRRKTHPEQQALGSRLCARLIPTCHEFNRNDVLLRLAVDFANAKATRVAQPCLQAVSDLLDGELVSDATQHIVQAVLDIVKKERHALNPKLVNCLLHIRVAMVDVHRPDVKEQAAKNKRMKKEDKELARQMMKAQGRRDRAELAAKQTKILHQVFVVYLRLLEASRQCSPQHQTKILAPALEGLAKFAPLVNLELHQLLLTALRELLALDTATVPTKLHALVAVACLAQKDPTMDGGDWRVDLTHFHNVLFGCITGALTPPAPERVSDKEQQDMAQEEDDRKTQAAQGKRPEDDVASVGSAASVGSIGSSAFSIAASMAQHKFVKAHAAKEWVYRVNVLVRAIDLLILSQKHVPASRVLCFVRRVLQHAAVCPPHIATSLYSLVHRLCSKYPTTAAALIGGNDYALVGRGVYDPECDDIHGCHPDGSFGWEISLARNSYHPTVRHIAGLVGSHYKKVGQTKPGAPPVLPTPALNRLQPYSLLEQLDPSNGEIQPAPALPKRGLRLPTPAAGGGSAGPRLNTDHSDMASARIGRQAAVDAQRAAAAMVLSDSDDEDDPTFVAPNPVRAAAAQGVVAKGILKKEGADKGKKRLRMAD